MLNHSWLCAMSCRSCGGRQWDCYTGGATGRLLVLNDTADTANDGNENYHTDNNANNHCRWRRS